MRTSLSPSDLESYVQGLLAVHLPDGYLVRTDLRTLLRRTLERVEYCFSRIERKYYRDRDETVLDHMNGDHMATFLWFLGNTVWRETGDEELPVRLSYVNRIMHGLDLFYSVNMPDIFLLVHPVGTVLGRATYSNYMVVYQNCTVGADGEAYPVFGEGVALYSRTSILGRCTVGPDVVFAANSFVLNTDVPGHTVVVGQYPRHRFLRNTMSVRERCFVAALPSPASAGPG